MSRYRTALELQIETEVKRYRMADSDYEKQYIKSVIYRLMKMLRSGRE